MGFETEIINGKRYYVKDEFRIRIQAWQPDISYDQMFMLVDKLRREGAQVVMAFNPPIDKDWYVSIEGHRFIHENIRTAFRFACTEFQTAK